MNRHAAPGAGSLSTRRVITTLAAYVLAFFVSVVGFAGQSSAQEGDLGFSPTSGHARVIAQGIVPLPTGDAVWRTVRTRALVSADALFEPRPLGFVVASSGPLLLVDRDTGEQTHLGTGEAALVREGTVQQRSSLAAQPMSYLSVELVSVDAAPPPAEAIVLQPGQPFAAPAGLRDLNLISDTLVGNELFVVPDSGAKNVVLVTDGAAAVGRVGNEPVVLLAGEAASFSGELQIGAAPAGESASAEDSASFVVAVIGPEIPPPALPTETAAQPPASPEAPGTVVGAETGSITLQVYSCPQGMTAENLNAAACAPATGDFDVTLSGTELAAPLTIGDAEPAGDAYVWDELAFGNYVIAEAVPPSGFATYILSARNTSGSAEAGYRVTLDPAEPSLTVRIYNFAPA